VEWRRLAHARFGTKFFETKSADFEDKTIYDKLMFFLKEHGYDFASMSGTGPALGEVEIKDRVTETLDGFISNRKLTGIGSDELRKKASGKGAWIVDSLPLAEAVATRYDEYLQARQEIDFTDMLLEAAKAYQQDPIDLGIRYLLVDEFQDMSTARLELVQGVLRNNPGCKLFAVGDDWQSINGFAGSELRIMTEFEEIFGTSSIQQLTATFRSNQGIANVASRFIMANPAQLKKEIHAADSTSDGVIEIHLFNNPLDPLPAAPGLMQSLPCKSEAKKRGSAFVLARYNSFLHPNNPSKFEWGQLNLANQIREVAQDAFDLKTPNFHRSKGLEADVVVLLGLVDRNLNRRCFPSRMQEDELVRLPLPDQESFPDAEERRLMYVALTRARHKVIIPVPMAGRSGFVSELFAFPDHVAVYHQGQRLAACPFCNEGFFLRKRDAWFECTNSRCVFGDTSTSHRCPDCETGALVVKVGQHGYFVGCNKYPDCSHIDKIRTPKLRHLVRPTSAKIVRPETSVQAPKHPFIGGELEGIDCS
jgi:DNA helicase IV